MPEPIDRNGLPPTFAFNAHTLQCYCDCPRLFWLSHVRRLPWPAVVAMPAAEHERRMRAGQEFHRKVQRFLCGVTAPVSRMGDGSEFALWLDTWQRSLEKNLPALREVELALSVTLPVPGVPEGSVRLNARLDLVAIEPQRRAVILDWKTGRPPTSPEVLAGRMQSLLYPWLLVEASAALPWGPLHPEQIEMRYWFASQPALPFTLRYNGTQHDAHACTLRALLADILKRQTEAEFPPAADTDECHRRLCSYCIYRSRCGRGDSPGEVSRMDGLSALAAPSDAAPIPLQP